MWNFLERIFLWDDEEKKLQKAFRKETLKLQMREMERRMEEIAVEISQLRSGDISEKNYHI